MKNLKPSSIFSDIKMMIVINLDITVRPNIVSRSVSQFDPRKPRFYELYKASDNNEVGLKGCATLLVYVKDGP